ncbi:hypothetical protein [Robiginitalea sp.]|uniref:hypothetical protein n=1 Tax=Robiginitalea sp. TaxID=1902411 RepID=UPI003C4EC2BE
MQSIKTCEIRWFYEQPMEHLTAFFGQLPEGAATFEERTDTYLIPVLEQGVGVKIRTNRIEVKSRKGNPVPTEIAPGLKGYRETWVKYGFVLQADQATHFNPVETPDAWLQVHKERRATLVEVSRGNCKFHPIGTNLSNCVQLEYTRVGIQNRFWYTFGLEWLAETPVEIPASFFYGILPPESLQRQESMSYPSFLYQQV